VSKWSWYPAFQRLFPSSGVDVMTVMFTRYVCTHVALHPSLDPMGKAALRQLISDVLSQRTGHLNPCCLSLVRTMFLNSAMCFIVSNENRHEIWYVECHNLYSSPSVIRMTKSRRMRLRGHVARMGKEECI
jgi:hypothetical protein